MQEELTTYPETSKEKKARVLARMRNQQTGTMKEPKKTSGDIRRINEFYGKRAEYYTDNMTLEEMKSVDMDTLKGTDRSAFIDVLMYKLTEEAKVEEDKKVEESIKKKKPKPVSKRKTSKGLESENLSSETENTIS